MSLCDRFDKDLFEKYHEQGEKETKTWIDTRLTKALEGAKMDPNLMSLFALQVETLNKVMLGAKELHKNLQEKDKKLQSSELKVSDLHQEIRDNQIYIKRAESKVSEAEEREREMKEQMDKSIQEKITFKIQAEEKIEKLELLTEENKNLRLKVADLDQQMGQTRK
jgi:chromosome segregation ATPase